MQAPHPKSCGADAWAGKSQPDSATSMHGCEADPQAERPQPSSAHASSQGYKHRGLIFDLLQSHLQRGPIAGLQQASHLGKHALATKSACRT